MFSKCIYLVLEDDVDFGMLVNSLHACSSITNTIYCLLGRRGGFKYPI